ncbi:sensor histidine kinase [Solihabitans fulvus]|nr:sensor histidine kinase [Solihabitans fulvus]
MRTLANWERRIDSVLGYIPYGSLAFATVLGLGSATQPLGYWIGTLAVVAVTAGWMLWMYTLHPGWMKRGGILAVYYVGLLVCIAVLVLRNPVYGFFAFTGYLHAIQLPVRWRVLGVAATALLTGTSQAGGLPREFTVSAVLGYLMIIAFNMALASTMMLLAWIVSQQSDKRREMVDALAEKNEQLATTLAENAGLHAQLLTQAREAGVLDERQRMAREIHDTIAQGLAGIVTQLQAAEQAEDAPAEWRRHLGNAAELARDSLSEARRSVRAIQPESLENARLPDALAEVASRWSAVHEIAAEFTTTGNARPMHPEVEVTLLRTAQEALANVAKHAYASRVGLTLSYMEDVVSLDVRDDGVGFDPERPRDMDRQDGGFGLMAMRQRVRRLAGRLDIESEPGAGTAISASVPAIASAASGE